MTTHINERTVTFRRAFTLGSLNEEFPAGHYTVQTLVEAQHGLTHRTYKSLTTTLVVGPGLGQPGQTRMIVIDPQDLQSAFSRDSRSAAAA
ncbi:MAG: hypothetical protein CMK09_17740 [Ponticaulis sp.]|nr:hypothetical protein [Ponticaulis sp.]|tara:strand:+ start:1470 stop:1742 length:273 start_codon:yes stop_codon:yes gene_type:complete